MPVKKRNSPLRQTKEDRFWAKVVTGDGCWAWTGAVAGNGYGTLGNGRRGSGMDYAHRFSYTLHIGPIPEGMLVLHRCDTPPCANPKHLFLGTHWDNSQDVASKGRSLGKTGPKTKLTQAQIDYIRATEWSVSCAKVAAKLGVGHNLIHYVRKNKDFGKNRR